MAKTYYMQTQSGDVFRTNRPEYHKECTQLSEAKGKAAIREWSINALKGMLQPDDKVYCLVRSVSSSGMSRKMSLYIVHNGELRGITGYVADVLQWGTDDNGYLKVSGCGMDMGFHTVYSLGYYLFKDGFGIVGESHNGVMAVKARPNSKEQAAEMLANGFRFHGRNGEASGWDDDGGYALKHEWM